MSVLELGQGSLESEAKTEGTLHGSHRRRTKKDSGDCRRGSNAVNYGLRFDMQRDIVTGFRIRLHPW